MTNTTLEVMFWACVAAIVYNYAGYPLALFILSTFSQAKSDLQFLIGKRTRRQPRAATGLPRVAILLSVYNEEAVIQAKVENFLTLDYPQDRLELLIGLDCPTDSTAALLSQYQCERVKIVASSKRQGKLAVLRSLLKLTSAEVVITTDANTMLDATCVRNLVRHFSDPRVGAVSGEERRIVTPGTDPSAESLYWRYESALKFLENRMNCSLGGNGSVLAVRRKLFRLRKPSIVEDFQIPLDIRFAGYRVVYDPEAIAVEDICPTPTAQFARRVRLGAGAYQALFDNLACLDPRKGMPAFCFFSHRVLRWVAPIFMIGAFLSSLCLVASPMFFLLSALQCCFYSSAFIGYLRKRRGERAGIFALPVHFCAMNLALLVGLIQYLSGRQSLAWKATPRAAQRTA